MALVCMCGELLLEHLASEGGEFLPEGGLSCFLEVQPQHRCCQSIESHSCPHASFSLISLGLRLDR